MTRPKRAGLLFPGQGAQYVGMGSDLAEAYPVARRIFQRADETLGFKISEICFNGPEEALTRTENAQPAIFAVSMAALEIFKQRHPETQINAVCGLSAGEFSALTAAGVFSFEDGLRLVRKRGLLMTAAAERNPGTMASIIGLSFDQCAEICRATGAEIANINATIQIVLSGRPDFVVRACQEARAKGAKRVVPLKVSGAFHSSLMKDAEKGLADYLSTVTFHPLSNGVTFIANVSGAPVTQAAEIREGLTKQLVSSVQWVRSMESLGKTDIDVLFEVGPGAVLKGLAARALKNIPVQSWGTASDMANGEPKVETMAAGL